MEVRVRGNAEWRRDLERRLPNWFVERAQPDDAEPDVNRKG
jgi:hypothetical protein